jgi:PleD family two-component response regulator
VTISGGVAVLNGETIAELINKADKKLYEAKDDGRNRINT